MLNLTVEEAKRIQQLTFAIFAYRFFAGGREPVESEQLSSTLRFPRPLRSLAFLLRVFIRNRSFFMGKHYLVRYRGKVVAIFAVVERSEALYILWLAVGREYRRMGIATYILGFAESLARQMKKRWLEVSVQKWNNTARRMYRKFGFLKKIARGKGFILAKKVSEVNGTVARAVRHKE